MYKENEEEGYYDLYIGSLKQIYATNLSHFFNGMKNIDSISFDNLDTSMVTNMNGMFNGTGYSNTLFTLDLGEKFDTSNVTDMGGMFADTPLKKLILGDTFKFVESGSENAKLTSAWKRADGKGKVLCIPCSLAVRYIVCD